MASAGLPSWTASTSTDPTTVVADNCLLSNSQTGDTCQAPDTLLTDWQWHRRG